MKPVGIIANPASGKDIRRLIARGTVVTNLEKINIIVRALKAMDAVGIENVFIMPDPTHIAQSVMDEVSGELSTTRVSVLDMSYILGTYKDSLRASQQMAELDFSCILVMGGDGTCRVVAKMSGDVPLMPISTGTNNVFPQMVEGTLAGLAAAAITSGFVSRADGCTRRPVLELCDEDGEVVETALVDLVAVDANDIGAKAVWDADSVRELFLTCTTIRTMTRTPIHTMASQIGLSSIGAWSQSVVNHDQADQKEEKCQGYHLLMGKEDGQPILAPIAPGLIEKVNVVSCEPFFGGEKVPLSYVPCVVAVDGEREVLVKAGQKRQVRLNPLGPLVIDFDRTLALAAMAGMMVIN